MGMIWYLVDLDKREYIVLGKIFERDVDGPVRAQISGWFEDEEYLSHDQVLLRIEWFLLHSRGHRIAFCPDKLIERIDPDYSALTEIHDLKDWLNKHPRTIDPEIEVAMVSESLVSALKAIVNEQAEK